MTTELHPVAGAKIYIGSAAVSTKAADFVASDFSSATWVEIDGWETMGAIGDAAQEIKTSLINRKRELKIKGTRDGGTMTNQFAIIPADTGQLALIAAEKAVENYPFKILYDDMPTSGTSGSIHYFLGMVMTASETGGNANTTRMLQSAIAINSNIVAVAAA